MPTFMFFQNKVRIDMLKGADHMALEDKIKKWYIQTEDTLEAGDNTLNVKGHVSTPSTCTKQYIKN